MLFDEPHFILSKWYASLSPLAPRKCFLFLKWSRVVGNASYKEPSLSWPPTFPFNTVLEAPLDPACGQHCLWPINSMQLRSLTSPCPPLRGTETGRIYSAFWKQAPSGAGEPKFFPKSCGEGCPLQVTWWTGLWLQGSETWAEFLSVLPV